MGAGLGEIVRCTILTMVDPRFTIQVVAPAGLNSGADNTSNSASLDWGQSTAALWARAMLSHEQESLVRREVLYLVMI